MKLSKFVLLFSLYILTTIVVAQQAWTNVTTIDCLDGQTFSYVPAQGAMGFCSASQNLPCQDAFKMGYPNAFGSLAGTDSNGPFVFNQQVTASPLYVVISDFNGRPAYKTRFFPQVDVYSLLELGGTAGNELIDVDTFPDGAPIDSQAAMQMNGTLIQVEFGGFTTPPVRRTFIPEPNPLDTIPVNNDQRRVVSYYTLIITLDRGFVSNLAWEAGCYGCGSSANCWKNGDNNNWCTTPFSECSVVNTSADANVSCNIKFYLGWQGTDAKGNYLMSGQSTIRNFLQFDVRTPFEDATTAFSKLGPSADDV